ncbi:three-helix bundle dimerization domain-containing protein [Nonomuraea turcica]|uniref:three-helix bundle dimerization domain-containing protein n=1 Tax=Nonomuraea sp. G32 TaxID=3067274 RepID=UPI00273A838A|nr:hypothetical protein [Nonomuraea sp. G32]MDP4511484.1 hypothetical protein [Nonomuraea sp. G32]
MHKSGQCGRLTDQLTSAFADDCKPEQITEAIDRAWKMFEKAPVRDFVPLLAARIAREELRRLNGGHHG